MSVPPVAPSNFTGPVQTPAGFQIGLQGIADTVSLQTFFKAAIADTTATSVARLTIPNFAQSVTALIVVRSGITAASHIYDSTRVSAYTLTVTRVPGAATVATLATVFGAAIATSSGGQTLTTALTITGVTGGNTVTQTMDLQITNIVSSAGITETQLLVALLNGNGTASIGQLTTPSGVTIAQV